jgi:glycosyltransferase involved in cell wall biosynthesis
MDQWRIGIVMSKKLKIFVLYRVIQHWRVPIFERIAGIEDVDFKILHGPDFDGTKVVNSKSGITFKSKKLVSYKIFRRSANGFIAMPFSPFLFFYLCLQQPDVIITEGASNLLNAAQGFLYCKLFRKKYIWWSLGKVQKRDYDASRKKIDRVIRYIEKHSDAIIAYSTIGKQYFLSIGIPEERIFVAVNVVDTARKLEALRSIDTGSVKQEFHKKHSFNVLFVGALNKEKNIEILIKAFAKLESEFNDVFLNIVGNGDHAGDLEALASALKIKNISFRGSIIEGVERYFIGSDVFVLPGLGGLAVSEAMIYSLSVIASIGDGCEADLVDRTNGFLDAELNEDSLFYYLKKLYADRDLLHKFKESSRLKIEQKYNVENYIKQISNAIHYTVS